MIQRDVAPQEQSLCFTVQARQDQYSHQIHLRWFTSRTKRATIQRRICVCDTVMTVSAVLSERQWAGRPNLRAPRSYTLDRYGAERPSEEPLRPELVASYSREPPRVRPPANRLMIQASASTAATMNIHLITKPALNAMIAKI